MTNFLPKDYEVPTTSNYMKLTDGKNTFRVLSPAITGYSYWTSKKKPVRSKDFPKDTPDICEDSKVKHFWAFTVWNYNDKQVQVFEITQRTIMDAMISLYEDSDWGDPKGYDITISRSGVELETKYQVMPKNKSELPEEIKLKTTERKINLNALYEGLDPFEKTMEEIIKDAGEKISPEDIPFN